MKALVPFAMVAPDNWPAPFSRFSAHRAPSNDPLAVSKATRWRPATLRQYAFSVGYFLGWLRWSGRYRDGLEVVGYATIDVARAYVDDMRQFGLAPPTIANRLDGVRALLSALAPDLCTRWLMAGINRLRREPSDRRRTRNRIQHTADVVAVGMDLMRKAMADESSHAISCATRFRDGLILVFASLAVPRIGALTVMAVGQHVAGSGKYYRISWTADEMKAGQPYDARLGPELSELMDVYIVTFRPTLLARSLAGTASREAGLWLSKFGKQLCGRSIYEIITKRTGAVFAEPVFPHALRHGAATTLAVERPDLIDIATPLLQHRDPRTRDYYNLANGVAASTRFGDTLQERRTASPQGRRLMRGLARQTGGRRGQASSGARKPIL